MKTSIYNKFKKLGGNPFVLYSRCSFIENATPADKRAMAKLTEEEFKELKWGSVSNLWENRVKN